MCPSHPLILILLGDERCTAITSSGPHSCRMTSLSRREFTHRDWCRHSHLPTKESTPAACSSWLLKEVGQWCTQQLSSRISSSANPTDAGTIPISLLRGYHGTTSADTVANFIASIVEVDGMVAARLVDSLATLESSLCKLSVGLYCKSDSNRTYEHYTYMHTFHHNEIFHFFFIKNPYM